jgi:hypothetical protein
MTAGPQHAHGFLDGGPPCLVARQVVDRKVTDDEIEGFVGKREIGHVAGVQFDPVGDALGVGVSQCGLHGVAGLVGPPDIHSHSTSPRHQLGRGQQDRATSAAEIEHTFVAAQA